MPITKSVVALMNGTISVENGKGVGKTFIVTVTLSPQEMSMPVIDDDPVACERAKPALRQVGVSCDTALSQNTIRKGKTS